MDHCKDCTFWGHEDRQDDYQVCYRVWCAGGMIAAEVKAFEKRIPKDRLSTPILTKPEFGCILFEAKQ